MPTKTDQIKTTRTSCVECLSPLESPACPLCDTCREAAEASQGYPQRRRGQLSPDARRNREGLTVGLAQAGRWIRETPQTIERRKRKLLEMIEAERQAREGVLARWTHESTGYACVASVHEGGVRMEVFDTNTGERAETVVTVAEWDRIARTLDVERRAHA